MKHPPFCPNPDCDEYYREGRDSESWLRKDGYYHSRCSGKIQRFRCNQCGTRFSEQTFSLDYFSKLHLNLRLLRKLIINGYSVRALARHFSVSPATVLRRIMIICRQSIAVHGELIAGATLSEDLVADGFQSFWVSHYHPNNFNLLTGADSQYLFGMTTATLRRSGSMTPFQKQRRQEIESLFPPSPNSLDHSFMELLNHAERLWRYVPLSKRTLRTDEHQVYRSCMRICSVPGVRHRTVSSRAPRGTSNPLFAANYLDREIRKDLAEHHRETLCFARNAALSTARMWIYMVAHNLEKRFRISPLVDCSHAEVAGIPEDVVAAAKQNLFRRRAFFTRSRLDHTLRKVWLGMIHTPETAGYSNDRLTPYYATR